MTVVVANVGFNDIAVVLSVWDATSISELVFDSWRDNVGSVNCKCTDDGIGIGADDVDVADIS